MTTAPTPTPAPARVLTKYRVFQIGATESTAGPQPSIKEAGRIAATNANAAVKKTAENNGAGTYVAVPESSWKPVTVTVETQTVVKLGDA